MDKFSKDNSKKYIPMLDLVEKTNYNKNVSNSPYRDQQNHPILNKSVSGSKIDIS